MITLMMRRKIYKYSTTVVESNGYANSSYWLRTGIGIKKYVHPNDISYTQKNSYDVDRIEHKADPAIRYAEVLLIYAEALNELTGSYEVPSWDGSKMHSVKRDITEMKKGIRPIRIRAGLPDYDKLKAMKLLMMIQMNSEGC